MMNVINRVKLPRRPHHSLPALGSALIYGALLAACAATAPTNTLTTMPSSAPAAPADADTARYGELLSSPFRSPDDRAMDATRHPAELLAFAGVTAGMRVLDVSAGGGYTTQLLALAVGPSGKVYAQVPRVGDTLAKRLAVRPQPEIVVVVRPFDDPMAPDQPPIDLATLILNYHDISYLPVDRVKMNRSIFAALKPGGHYVIIDHAARRGTGVADGKTLHRIDEATVIAEVKAAGFTLANEGAFLRNAADDHTQSSGDMTGPTDRFALRFIKPG